MKAILMSIQPKWLAKILNGEKTIEIRKSVSKDFKGWVYLYCTKHKKDYITVVDSDFVFSTDGEFCSWGSDVLNGLVVARFWLDDYEYFDSIFEDFIHSVGKPEGCSVSYDKNWLSISMFETLAVSKGCLTVEELWDYFPEGINDVGYAWHINNLEVFDKPKELGEFCKYGYKSEIRAINDIHTITNEKKEFYINQRRLKKAPQSWQYVEVVE